MNEAEAVFQVRATGHRTDEDGNEVACSFADVLVSYSVFSRAADGDAGIAGDTAVGGIDFEASSGSVTLSSDSSTATIAVGITDDSLDEWDETFTVELSGGGEGVEITSATATGTILEDSADEAPLVSISDVSVTEVDPDDLDPDPEDDVPSGLVIATFTVSLSGESGKEITVGYTINTLSPDQFSPSDTSVLAELGVDVAAGSGTLTFAPGETEKTIEVSVLPDFLDEYDEVFHVVLSGSTNATLDKEGDELADENLIVGIGTIIDNDDPPTVTIVPTATVTEGADGATTTINLDVSLSVVSGRDVMVQYFTTDATAMAADGDYNEVSVACPEVITISAGQLSRSISITVNGDYRDELEETFSVTIGNPTNATLGATTVSTVTIEDDDDLVVPDDQDDKEGKVVSLQIEGNSPGYSPNGGTFSAANLPPGLTINSSTAKITGKISYLASVGSPYSVTVTLTDSGGNTVGSVAFDWIVRDAFIDTLTARELFGGTSTSTFQSTTGLTYATLYVSPGNTVKLVVATPADLPDDLNDVLFAVGTIANDDFAPTPTFTPSPGAPNRVLVGIDLNLNRMLDAGEATHSIDVFVINFTGTTFAAQRVSGPAEATHYPILADEHFEVGGNFDFQIAGAATAGSPSLIRYASRHCSEPSTRRYIAGAATGSRARRAARVRHRPRQSAGESRAGDSSVCTSGPRGSPGEVAALRTRQWKGGLARTSQTVGFGKLHFDQRLRAGRGGSV